MAHAPHLNSPLDFEQLVAIEKLQHMHVYSKSSTIATVLAPLLCEHVEAGGDLVKAEEILRVKLGNKALEWRVIDGIWGFFAVYVVSFGVLMVLASLVIGFLLAIPLGTVQAVGPLWARSLVFAYSYVFRGTPLLVQTFLLYYGLAQFEAVRQSWAWDYLSSATFCAFRKSTTSGSVSVWPALGTTTAQARSPRRSSGTATTATWATAGCL